MVTLARIQTRWRTICSSMARMSASRSSAGLQLLPCTTVKHELLHTNLTNEGRVGANAAAQYVRGQGGADDEVMESVGCRRISAQVQQRSGDDDDDK